MPGPLPRADIRARNFAELFAMCSVDSAAAYFGRGFSCSQAVLGAYGERFGLGREMAFRLADGLGGGMAGLGKTCGAVTGAMLVLGLAYGRSRADDPRAKVATSTAIRQLVSRFEARHGSVACRDLLDCDIDTPHKLEMARQRGLFTTLCPVFVRSAAELLDELLAEPKPE
jgi:C_GCAxxG_C_C family probable redox protein